jgi:hypothetical protein
MSEEITATSFDDCLDALDHVERRRLLLALLNGTSGAGGVAFGRLDVTNADGTMKLAMYHVHLPKLERLGFVDADWDRRSVARGARFDGIRPLLELLDDNRDRLPNGMT